MGTVSMIGISVSFNTGVVAGFGILGYALAVLALERHAARLQDKK